MLRPFIENYTELCTVAADISHLPQPAKKGPTGDYYEVYYDIVLIFGLTEFQILVAWEDKVSLISWIWMPLDFSKFSISRALKRGV